MKAAADLSFLHLIIGASIPVQAVIVLLMLLSLWSWWLIFYKGGMLKRAARRNTSFDDSFWQGSDLNALYARVSEGREKFGPQAEVFAAGFREFIKQKRQTSASKEAVVDGTRRALKAATQRVVDGLEHRLPGLATVASVSPYIGLLGTVWGIMNSFTAIAQSKDTSLAVVAPGIAEALFATAVGLAAAIPAVIFYNQITVALGRAADRAAPAIVGLARSLSRSGVEGTN